MSEKMVRHGNIGLVADSNGAVRKTPEIPRPRTLDALWQLVTTMNHTLELQQRAQHLQREELDRSTRMVDDLAKENAELRWEVDILVGRVNTLEAWQGETPSGSLLEMGEDES